MARQFVSDREKWERIYHEWAGSGLVETLKEACDAIDEANGVLSGNGFSGIRKPDQGNISGIESLYEELKDISRSIHDRAEAEIDDPFCHGLAQAADEAYRINPNEITVGNISSGGKTMSIIDLLMPAAKVDKDLKRDFDAAVRIIGKMEPDKSLQQAIVDAVARYNRGDDINSVTGSDIKLLIKYYELMSPGDAMALNDLFKGVEKTGNVPKNIDNIKYIAYSSVEPFRSLFFDSLVHANMGYTGPYEETVNGQVETVKEFGFYNNGVINIDLTTADWYWTCRVFFHEYGHYVDAYYGKASVPLNDAIYSDVYGNLRTEIAKKTSNNNKTDIILESLKKGGTALSDTDLNDIRDEIINLYFDGKNKTGLLYDEKFVVAADVYGGVTDNNVHGRWFHFPEIKTDYERYYWYDINGNATGAQYREYFAESFSNGMTQNSDALANADVYFPNANVEFTEIVNSLAGK